MHKGVILLVKAHNKYEANDLVSEFMEQYGDGQVWDWYSIGGRWSNIFAPSDKVKAFKEWVKESFTDAFNEYGYTPSKLEVPQARKVIQKKWRSMGLKGKNIYYSGFGFDVDEEEPYNTVRLNKALPIVKEWVIDIEKEEKYLWNKMAEGRLELGSPDEYYVAKYKHLMCGDFSFDSNVYDISKNEGEQIPENVTGYFAVIVDMHK